MCAGKAGKGRGKAAAAAADSSEGEPYQPEESDDDEADASSSGSEADDEGLAAVEVEEIEPVKVQPGPGLAYDKCRAASAVEGSAVNDQEAAVEELGPAAHLCAHGKGKGQDGKSKGVVRQEQSDKCTTADVPYKLVPLCCCAPDHSCAQGKGKGKGKGEDGKSKAAFRREQSDNAARAADRMIKEGAKKWASTKKAVSALHEVSLL